ncbi:hypothetical protein EYF80_046280 [Liparis tanakae]|uniref:Uncharacterized protein n=1 Tax=Liparis tanakae TaxID=230148 RepID=A0A4Z2FQK7_9TELE|nr:hypothetical protein EYF80_046280 [Liparis tanakae]
MALQAAEPNDKRSPGKKSVYLCGREAAQGVPLLGEPFDHRQGRSHVPQEGVDVTFPLIPEMRGLQSRSL